MHAWLGLLFVGLAQPDGPRKVELAVSPAAAPSPALKYELLPKLRERQPGNAAVGYLRAAILRPGWPLDPKDARTLSDTLLRWDDTRADALPVDAVKSFLKKNRDLLAELDDSARLDRCDWQQAARLRPEDIDGLLPVVQAHRELGRILAYRVKIETAENRFDAGIRSLQTGLKHGKDVGEGPSLIPLFVGVSLCQSMLHRAEELIARPGAPNLYWALTTLPRPLVDAKPALEGETEFQTSFIPSLREMEKGAVAEELANRTLEAAFRGLGHGAEGESDPFANAVVRGVFLATQGPPARKDLAARGWSKSDADAMPAAQAILLRAIARHRALWDDQVKLFALPYPVAAPEMAACVKRADAARKQHADDTLFVALALAYPGLQKLHAAQARLERQVALLRAIEAIRLHAALHGNEPPATLAEAATVPIPDDPLTGRPFGYVCIGDTFTLTASAPPGEPVGPTTSQEYVVTVRR